MRLLATAILIAGLVAAAPAMRAGAETLLPTAAKPEDVGLSSEQLARLEAATRANMDAGLLSGTIMVVVKDVKIGWQRVMGQRDKAKNLPMQPDSLFRIYSMTKPIVSVAIMMLVEQGRMQIDDPVSRYLPEFADVKVGVEKKDADGKATLELVAPTRAMTIQDLLRHTSGLIYGTRGESLVNKAYIEARIGERSVNSEEFSRKVAKLPLRFSPGTRWEYGVSTDILGRVIEVVTKMTLGEALDEMVHRPLGMVDTAFVVPEAKLARAAQPAVSHKDRPMTPRFDVGAKAAFESGGGGLVGSTDDYLRFMMMLANGGSLNGTRLLGPQTVAFMTSDHTGAIPGRPPALPMGLGFEVRKSVGNAVLPGSVGEYGWGGNAGTLFWIDPQRKLMALYMVQVNDYDRIFLRNQFRVMVQGAIAK